MEGSFLQSPSMFSYSYIFLTLSLLLQTKNCRSHCRFQTYGVDLASFQILLMGMCHGLSHWPQSQEGDWARPHLCKLARHGP